VIGSGFWAFREMIMPGAFTDAVKNDDVRALFNHDPNLLLGRTASKTLRIKEDKSGLRYDVDLPDTFAGRDVQTLIKRGDVSGSSFAFTVNDEDQEWDESEVKSGKLPLRKIMRISTLYDVSPVTYPAYPTTTVSARSRAKAANESRTVAPPAAETRADDSSVQTTADQARHAEACALIEKAEAWRPLA
jgi:HK97 family phage prohead protease